MPMNERANTMISVQFGTHSPNGLLYFRGSPSSGEFIAIGLEQGAITLKANFGAESEISVRSAQSNYANGDVHKIRVIRNRGEIHLQVIFNYNSIKNFFFLKIDGDNGDRVSTTLRDENETLSIPEPDHYVGGVPPKFDQSAFAKHNIPFSGFFGCIQSVKPNQVSELDLDHPTRAQRKEPGCIYHEDRLMTADRVISFPTPGYLIAKGLVLDVESTLSFNLRTRSANAVLLYESGRERSDRKRKRSDDEADNHVCIILFKK